MIIKIEVRGERREGVGGEGEGRWGGEGGGRWGEGGSGLYFVDLIQIMTSCDLNSLLNI